MLSSVQRSNDESPIPTSSGFNKDLNTDANNALFELEKGLRSLKLGEQCEAIVQLSNKLEKYPFPLLVNSAFLKLAEVFRMGSNFLKLCVLKAIQSSKKHLDKIFNVDEFCRRFFAVIHSNDPIARSITLRVFGNISCIISERKNIHHCIRTSLDSHDVEEVEAAIFATKCFAEQSRSFASSIWQPVTEMIKGLVTPIDIKLKLIPVLKFMYHDTNVAKEIFAICEELLSSYPSHHFVVSVLNATTQLAVPTLLHIPRQIDMLLRYTREEPRKSINHVAINNLLLLAKKTPHLWSEQQVQSLLEMGTDCLHLNIKIKTMNVLSLLASSCNCHQMFTKDVLDGLEYLTNDMSLEVSSLALKIKIQALLSSTEELAEEHRTCVQSDIQTMLAMCCAEESFNALKNCLSAMELLVKKYHGQSEELIAFICECLNNMNGECLLQVLHSLVTMATQIDGLCTDHVAGLMSLLKERLQGVEDKQQQDIIVGFLTLIFQSSYTFGSSAKKDVENEILQQLASSLTDHHMYWVLYRITRQASKLGLPNIAASLLKLLASKVASESLYFWLNSLQHFHEGESLLLSNADSSNGKLLEKLSSSHDHYQEGLTNLKAAITTDHPLYFQFKYARLRADTLRAYSQLLACCSVFKLNPPPSNAFIQASKTGQDPYQFSRVAVQFQNCAAKFSGVAYGYQNLHKVSFNADQTTLNTIRCLQESCQLMVEAIESLFTPINHQQQQRGSSQGSERSEEEERKTGDNLFCRNVTKTNLHILQQLQNSKTEHLSIKNINVLTTIIQSQLNIAFSYPHFFYKRQQNTQIQLSVSPCNHMMEDPFLIHLNHQMTIKVEGVILNQPQSVYFRRASEVRIQLKMRPNDNVKNPSNEHKPVQVEDFVLKESTPPHYDFFSAQFLVPFKYVGRHTIKISTGLTDEHGVDWDAGPSYTVFVDVQEPGAHARKR